METKPPSLLGKVVTNGDSLNPRIRVTMILIASVKSNNLVATDVFSTMKENCIVLMTIGGS